MAEKYEVTKIHYPASLNDLLALVKTKPGAALFAGGTWLLRDQQRPKFKLPEILVSLQGVEDLKKIGRTETRIDIGAAVSLHHIIKAGKKFLPPIFVETLEGIVPPGLRGLATLGGNVCVRDRAMTSHPTLHILDARLEFRRSEGARWVPATRLRNQDGTLAAGKDEVLTKIRLPLETWNIQYFRRLGTNPFADAEDSLVFSAVARTSRGILGDFRFAAGTHAPKIYRNRDLETSVIGRKLPLNPKDVAAFMDLLAADIDEQALCSAFQRRRILGLVKDLIETFPAY